MNVDLAIVARDLKLPPEKIQETVTLLDAGNTIPFITRFRKDLTGGLNEQQILAIKQRVTQLRALAERKAFITKSIESQSKLSDELKLEIDKATTSRRLESIYLPFKPKKQSRATIARQQGLEPLADEIFAGNSPDVDLATRATDFVRVDKGLTSVDEVIKGVSDLLAERFSENDDLRTKLRQAMWNHGKLVAQLIAVPEEPQAAPATEPAKQNAEPDTTVKKAGLPKAAEPTTTATTTEKVEAEKTETPETTTAEVADSKTADSKTAEENSATDVNQEPAKTPTVDAAAPTDAAPVTSTPNADGTTEAESTQEGTAGAPEKNTAAPTPIEPTATEATAADKPATGTAAETPVTAPAKKKKKKKKKKKVADDPFKDYHDFKQPVKQIPHHRILAINRGERGNKLKVKIQADEKKQIEMTTAAVVPADHPSSEFLNKCAVESLNRLILPSIERELRRELTEAAEKHAVEVFANNLRNLLLQPPIRNKTVLAIDPGFKRGCSVAVLDHCSNLLDSGHVFVVGNQTRRDEGKKKIVQWAIKHNVDVIAIGNGAACRQAEQMVSDAIAEGLKDKNVKYGMVNGAGASVYSTSEIGREELPDLAPSIRSAISIGRRLQDPLSELVKISPANIGVGMYQHDVKAKHLAESLDDVVEFCVNKVGVDVNTASPSLLKYVSGLNALTARRMVEHRQEKGRFKNRLQLKEVSGFGDATYVQAAGFLRIRGGDTPLDGTSIHPESYELAASIAQGIDATIEDFLPLTPEIPAEDSSAQETSAESTSAESTSAENTPAEPTPPAETTAELPAAETPATETTSEESPKEVDTASDATSVEPAVSATEAAPAVEAITPPEAAPPEAAPIAKPTPAAPTSALPTLTTQQLEKRQQIVSRLNELKLTEISEKHGQGQLLVRDIVLALKRPDWDPRDRISKPIFRSGIIKVEDLKPEMQLDGQVVNVVDFGVFVDIGLGESSLIHVSQLSNQFIRDPYRHFSIGDVLKVWVTEVDIERRRAKLTAVRPGTKAPQRHSRPKRSSSRSEGQSGDSRRKPEGNRGGGGGARGKGKPAGGNFSRKPRRDSGKRSKPKPVKPITDSMLKGDEPMRSFSDLAQFVTKKDPPSKKKSDS